MVPMPGQNGAMQTLEHKLEASETLLLSLLENHDPNAVRVAWTGGKDSTTALFIWKAVLAHAGKGAPRAISLDTGCKFPEVLAFRDAMTREWGVDLFVARPEVSLSGYPLAGDPVSCCRELKIEPLKRAIGETETRVLITGIRRDEHPDRAGRSSLEQRDTLSGWPAHMVCNPLLDWTETDIWAFHARFGLAHCPLYDHGYRSLGCMPCTTRGQGGERSGRAAAKEAHMAQLSSLGYF